jgi:Ca-activated chloride channel family protein
MNRITSRISDPVLIVTALFLIAILVVLGACSNGGQPDRWQRETSASSSGTGVALTPSPTPLAKSQPDFSGETYPYLNEARFLDPKETPFSTFSIDVDTASYVTLRRYLEAESLPPRDAIRIEELVNYFEYDYPRPQGNDPFAISTKIVPSPWQGAQQLLHIAVQGKDLRTAERPKANLVLLVDVSGSMEGADRLDLLKKSFRLLLDGLATDDRVAIVTYASSASIALKPTLVADKGEILSVISGLRAGGSTAGAAGLETAYDLAGVHFDDAGLNRVILATDGDFNVGASDPHKLKDLIASRRRSGIYLSVVTVGNGNVNDAVAQALAQNGNGQADHIDGLAEARRVFVERLNANLQPIARDVKIQVEFNPTAVSAYRLLGYETRVLSTYDYVDDTRDAGDVGSGHSVTAIYEIIPAGAGIASRYRRANTEETNRVESDEVAFVKLRYKDPKGMTSKEITQAVAKSAVLPALAEAPADVRFSIAVAGFGKALREGGYLGDFGPGALAELAGAARGTDPEGDRAAFLRLVRQADTLLTLQVGENSAAY